MTKSATSATYPHAQASLYVGDLQPEVVESQLFEKFSAIGPVLSIRICRDAITKSSLGYGYVNFSKPADAERALEELNFEPVAGHPVRLMWTHRDPSLRRSGDGNIFIKNLDKSVDHKELFDTFSTFGKILSAKVALREDGASKGFGFVHFETQDSAKEAIEKVNGKLIKGKPVFVAAFKSRAARAAEMGEDFPKFTNVYVKNLGPDMTEAKFKEMGAKFGEILSIFLPTDQETKRSRGFGFIAYKTSEAAHAAVAGLNGKELEGSNGNVKLYAGRAMKKEERQADLRHKMELRRRQAAAQRSQLTNLYVKNLEESVTEDRLKSEFGKYGTLTSAKLMTDDKGISRGFGFVCFASAEEANKAVAEMNGRILVTKPLYVAIAQRKEDRRAQLANQFMQYRTGAGAPGAKAAAVPGMYGAGAVPGGGGGSGYFMPAANTGYPSAPAFVANARGPQMAMSGSYGGGRYGGSGGGGYGRYSASTTGYPSYGPPQQRTGGGGRSMGGQPTATRLIQGYGGDSRWAGAAVPTGTGYHVQYYAGARNRPTEASLMGKNEHAHAASPAEEKQVLGEQLYEMVKELVEEGFAGKVTGMLLEMPNEEIVKILHHSPKLQAKVHEAVAVLRESGMKG